MLAGLTLALAVFVAYAGVRDNGFLNWDDDLYVTRNPHVQSLSTANLAWMLRNTLPQWGPLAFAAHAVDVRLFGLDPGAHHLTSVGLHACVAVLVLFAFLSLSRASGVPWTKNARVAGGFAAALLFALHPLRVESVAWASEKKDLLCALFMLIALLAWLRRAAATTAAARRTAFVLANLAVALALLSKPMAVTLPVLLLVLDAYPLGRMSWAGWPRLLSEKALMIAFAALVGGITVAPPREAAPRMRVGVMESSARTLLPLRSATFHLQKTLWPEPLVAFYPAPPPARRRLADPEFALSALLVAAASLAALWRWSRGERYWLAAWAFYGVALLPVSGLWPLAGQVGADRFSYVPTLPLFLLAGAVVARAWATRARALLLGLVAALALVFGLMTRAQVRLWRDSETFWGHVVAVFPGQVVMAHNNLGALFHERGLREGSLEELARAEAQYRQAIALVPRHANAWNNLGLIHEQRGERAEAERCYRRALLIAPRHPQAQANLGRLLATAGPVAAP